MWNLVFGMLEVFELLLHLDFEGLQFYSFKEASYTGLLYNPTAKITNH